MYFLSFMHKCGFVSLDPTPNPIPPDLIYFEGQEVSYTMHYGSCKIRVKFSLFPYS